MHVPEALPCGSRHVSAHFALEGRARVLAFSRSQCALSLVRRRCFAVAQLPVWLPRRRHFAGMGSCLWPSGRYRSRCCVPSCGVATLPRCPCARRPYVLRAFGHRLAFAFCMGPQVGASTPMSDQPLARVSVETRFHVLKVPAPMPLDCCGELASFRLCVSLLCSGPE